MYKFSFLLPTRGRPELVKRFFESILNTAHNIEGIEVVLCLDEDDLESQNISDERLSIKKVILPKGANMGALNRACFGASSGRYLMLINDDVIIRTKNWDQIIMKIFYVFKDDIALIHVNDLLFRDSLCTFPILSRRACLAIGICPEEYRKYRIDDHIYDTYQMLAYLGHKRIVYLDDVIFEHDNKIRNQQIHLSHNFKNGIKGGEVPISNKEIIELDLKTFNEKLEERKKNALTLALLIDQDTIERKSSVYRGLLNDIKDPYSYRKKDFVRRIELAQIDTITEDQGLNISVFIPNIQKKSLEKCVSIMKRYIPDSELIILNESTGALIRFEREENRVGEKILPGEIFLKKLIIRIFSYYWIKKTFKNLLILSKKYYSLPYSLRKFTDKLMIGLINRIRIIFYRNFPP